MYRPSRREALQLLVGTLGASSLSRWFPLFAAEAATDPNRRRSCILMWMPGGPSQLDTFDPKPGHENGGEFKPIATSVPGIQISEHLPQLAMQAEHLAIVRSMQTKEGDHGRASYHLRTGYRPQGPVQYPTLGSLLSGPLAHGENDLPNYISILPSTIANAAAFTPGFLGPGRSPLIVGGERTAARMPDGTPFEYGAPLEVQNVRLAEGIGRPQADARLDLLQFIDAKFSKQRPGLPTESHRSAYEQAVRMMRSPAMEAFDLNSESAEVRDAYGKTRFGQACLLARRLVERGVPFVEVALSSPDGSAGLGWDTHQDNFETVKTLSGILDPAWSSLIRELKERGLLETTLIVWMGEFGRTPVINDNTGRDHFPNAWSTVLCGGGIQGGQVYGATNESGMEVAEKPVPVNQLMATICGALGVDHTLQNMSNVGRPIRLVEPEAEPISEIVHA